MPIITNDDYTTIKQRFRKVKFAIQILNNKFQVVDEIQKGVFSGSIDVSADSDIRRTCNVSIADPKNQFNYFEGQRLWLDKYFRIIAQVLNNRTSVYQSFKLGTFNIDEPEKAWDATTNTLNIKGVDLMGKLTGAFGGFVEGLMTVIPVNTSIRNAIISIVSGLGGFNNYIIEDISEIIPYDIKKSVGSSLYDLLSEVVGLYKKQEIFFDVDDNFIYRTMPEFDPNTRPILDFVDDKDLNNLIIRDGATFTKQQSPTNVKNHIKVYGKLLSNGIQYIGEAKNNNPKSPFAIDKIGERFLALAGGEYDYLYTQKMVDERADYELNLHTNLQDKINFNVVPIYFLDANEKIRIKDNIGKVEDANYLIKNMTIPISDITQSMTIEAVRAYN